MRVSKDFISHTITKKDKLYLRYYIQTNKFKITRATQNSIPSTELVEMMKFVNEYRKANNLEGAVFEKDPEKSYNLRSTSQNITESQ